MSERGRDIGLAIAAGALLLFGLHVAPFFRFGLSGMGVDIPELRGPSFTLHLVVTSGGDTPLSVLAAYGLGHLTCLALPLALYLDLGRDDDRGRRVLGWLGVSAALAIIAAAVIVGGEMRLLIKPSWGVLLAAAGAATAAWLGLRRDGGAVSDTWVAPSLRVAAPSAGTPGIRGAVPGPSAAPVPPRPVEPIPLDAPPRRERQVGRGDYARAVDQAGHTEYQRRAVGKRPKNQKIGSVGPAAVDAARQALRFVARRCALTDAGLEVQTERGETRSLTWTDLHGIIAFRLPPDPPFEKRLVVDFVPRSGPPVRLLQSTHINYAALPDGAGASSTENLRALGRYLRRRNPAIDWDQSADFFEHGQAPRVLPSVRHFADYDVRYD